MTSCVIQLHTMYCTVKELTGVFFSDDNILCVAFGKKVENGGRGREELAELC